MTHVPNKCYSCAHITLPTEGPKQTIKERYPCISIIFQFKSIPSKLVLDTGCSIPYIILSKSEYNELLPGCRIPQNIPEVKNVVKEMTGKQIAGQTIKENDIEGVLKVKFFLPGDEKYNIIRSVFTCTFQKDIPNLEGVSIIGLNAFKKNFVINGDTEIEDTLEISLLPNKGFGYICRGISDIVCSCK